MDISPKKRLKIVTLGQHTSMTQREISRACNVSLGAVNKILRQQKETGSVEVKRVGRCGRKRKTTARDEAFLIRNSKMDPKKTSADLQQDLAEHGVHIHESTVRKRLIEVGRRAIRPQKKQLLTGPMIKKRLAWARKYVNWTTEDWKKVLFSDETHFVVQGQRSRFVRKSAGEKLTSRHFVQTVKHPPKKMFWGCFSYMGPGSLVPVEGMMNGVKYKTLLERTLQSNLDKVGVDYSIFQQDSAPCHKSKLVTSYLKNKNSTCLDWPGNSPDLNPIENLWAICKERVRKKDCTTMQKLVEAVIEVWFWDPQIHENCRNLIDSMPRRVQDVIKAKGGHTSY